MSCDLLKLATPGVAGILPYNPGKPMEELERELGITDIIKLASNENPLGPSAKVLDTLSSAKDLFRYPDGNGFSLKRAIAEFHHVNMDQITLGNGSNDILDLIARVLLTDKDEAIYSEHAFAIYSLAVKSVGARGVEVAASEFGHDLHAMAGAINEKTRLVYIANPNNPTGTWLGNEALMTFMETTPDNVIVLIDQAYYEYACGEDYPDCIEWINKYNNLIVTRTFSKAYGMAALRVGYSISHPDIADLLNRVRHPFNVNSLALVTAEVALQDQDHIERAVEFNKRGMRQLIQGFDELGIHFIPSRGNFLSFDLEQESMGVFESLLKLGVIVRPIGAYGMPHHLRVTVGLENENERFLSCLVKVLSR